MFNTLVARGVRHLYHFTDQVNLASIRRCGGLYSWKKLVEMGIENVRPGGNDWSHDADSIVGVDRFVHLCFFQEHPMEYVARSDSRISLTSWIKVNIDVLQHIQGIRYTPGVSNKTGMSLLNNQEALECLDFPAIYDFIDFAIDGNKERKNDAKKYEILVPDHIPLRFLEM